MLGAILGDIVGSAYERRPTKRVDFPLFLPESRFTDDTVLTAATAEALMCQAAAGPASEEERAERYAARYRRYYFRYPDAGFGGMFRAWCRAPGLPVQESYGNGGAMRVSPIGFALDTPQAVLREAEISCRFTHRHPEGTAGAQAAALAVFLARTGCSKEEIAVRIRRRFGYDLSRPLRSIRPGFVFDSRAGYSVPPAIRAFLESDDVESAIRLAVSLGGDSDTMACIAGGIAHAYYGAVPPPLARQGLARLDGSLRGVVCAFCTRYRIPGAEAWA
ncbi:MAG TPA: ADP-ribosylglycohydrolase family protein [Firmicutes bacterium]|nr:ADP-ribosylglycohydrolase family protein [Bacillota bacterium]